MKKRYSNIITGIICFGLGFLLSFLLRRNNNKELSDYKHEEQVKDDGIHDKIEQSRSAYNPATEFDSTISANYEVKDLSVAVGGNGRVSISGFVKNDNDKKNIENLILSDERVNEIINALIIK